ncbi:MAG: hypothetical protein NUW22_13245, partial [Acidobacteria bacterium]|nr:hypothetical protein [Acidobacteriota bacterium]
MTAFPKRQQTGRERPAPVKRGGLRKRSVKMEDRLTDEYAEARRVYLMTHRECEIKVRGLCTRWSKEIQHKAGRTGAALTDPEN